MPESSQCTPSQGCLAPHFGRMAGSGMAWGNPVACHSGAPWQDRWRWGGHKLGGEEVFGMGWCLWGKLELM